jgi:large subunit ribosomal protein L9
MKVIFLKDVPKMGRRYEVKNVSDGYALNFLIPRKMVVSATPDALKRMEVEKARMDGEKKLEQELLEKSLKTLSGSSITIYSKANEKGHLFAGLHSQNIADELEKQTNVKVPSEFIDLQSPIKELGEHTIKVKTAGKSAEFKLLILQK